LFQESRRRPKDCIADLKKDKKGGGRQGLPTVVYCH